MAAILNSPAHTELTLGDVRNAHELAAELADCLANDEPWEIADWADKAQSIYDLLSNVLRRHRVTPAVFQLGEIIEPTATCERPELPVRRE